jgi:hypothetical protein
VQAATADAALTAMVDQVRHALAASQPPGMESGDKTSTAGSSSVCGDSSSSIANDSAGGSNSMQWAEAIVQVGTLHVLATSG